MFVSYRHTIEDERAESVAESNLGKFGGDCEFFGFDAKVLTAL
jgi:hypothetical protein